MKQHKKSWHRVPPLTMSSDPVDERYQAVVDKCTSRLEERYRKAQEALQRAEGNAQKARQRKADSDKTKKLQQLVELRRQELEEIERTLMMPTVLLGGRDSRRRTVRHETAEINIPIGKTHGNRRLCQ